MINGPLQQVPVFPQEAHSDVSADLVNIRKSRVLALKREEMYECERRFRLPGGASTYATRTVTDPKGISRNNMTRELGNHFYIRDGPSLVYFSHIFQVGLTK